MHLSLALHNHQPAGNFGWVMQEAYDRAYLPMVACLERHPTIHLALHYTGPLRDWLQDFQPDFIPRVKGLVDRGQIEIMTGTYYEAVLVSLVDADKLGQIQKLTDAVKKDFGIEPTGLWLAERIWEPHLPATLADAGIHYTIVDDTHFKAVGYRDEDLLGYYVTEDVGKLVKVFGTSMPLRYSIPWRPVEATIDWLREQAERSATSAGDSERRAVAVMGDDGEKFGLWPGTYEHVWEKGWMDRFFDAVEASADWLETIPPGQAAREFAGLGRVYLPATSYDEMGEWAMPPDEAFQLHALRAQLTTEGREDIAHYMRGGLWRNFMVKYVEVNQLQKKAAWVSRKVHAMRDGTLKQQALDSLWAGQCNCAYWHGVFGGVYLFHIREADYRHLITAENLADGIIDNTPAKPFARVAIIDFDLDAVDDAVISTDQQCLVIDADQGGSLVEWDFRAAGYNLLNVMTRRREAYHKTLVDAAAQGLVVTPGSEAQDGSPENIHSNVVRAREPNLDEKLIFDWYRKASLIDHFLGKGATLDSYYRANYEELGDYVDQPYTVSAEKRTKPDVEIVLSRLGKVWQGATQIPILIEKRLMARPDSRVLTAAYTISNKGSKALDARFGVETNWGFAGGNEAHTTVEIESVKYRLNEIAENEGAAGMALTSGLWGIRVDMRWVQMANVWRFPLETVSASEGGFESNYQGTTILIWWPVQLKAGESWSTSLRFELILLNS